MESKTHQAIELYKQGDLKACLKMVKTFKIGFTPNEQKTITIAYEMLTDCGFLYKQLGYKLSDQLQMAEQIITNKYTLNNENLQKLLCTS